MAEHEMTTPADIDQLLLGRENENLEFKHAANSFDFDELVKYCVALANEGGGRILFGVSDKPPRRVLGSLALRDPDTAFRVIQRIQLRVGIEEVQHPHGRVVVVSVPARPPGQPLHDRGRYLVRVGENVQPMLPEQMRRIFDEAVPDFSASVVSGASRFDLEETAILRFRELWARKSGRPELTEGPWAPALEDVELLQAGLPTVSCLVLLGSTRALDRFLPQAEIVHEYRDNPGDLTAAKRVEFRRPFILEFDEIWQSINAFNKEELLEDGFFKWPVPMLRERVVREAVLNVVAHRDYRSHASAFLRQTPTELSIVSPGGLPALRDRYQLKWTPFFGPPRDLETGTAP